ncbi:tetratricopeptide repeat protein, partial [Verrucomicrobia bacterium]|nr:tetratricopeptide repeat protein [Verrucomicrobiota bacterium]
MKAKGRHLILAGLVFTSIWGASHVTAADSLETLNSQDSRIRERYEQVLERNPFQARAFTQVFDSYVNLEGVDAWVDKLKPKLDKPESQQSTGIILGQIYARQFKTPEAIKILEQVSLAEGNPPEFNRLLGTLFYREGENEKGIQLLTLALNTLTDLEERTQVSRMLGNLFLRDGNTEQAIEVWKQVTAQTPNDLFAQLELGEIYQENRLWDEAIEVYQQIASLSDRDPYRKCRALRSIGNCQLQAERFPEAIATYETALELVSPGNWLFEDLKLRLVQVYEDMGDLSGLVNYVKARLKQNPTDIEFRDLLAETYLRTNQLQSAETEYQSILERNPRHAVTFEKLIALYQRLDQPTNVTQAFEKLIELFPADTDYLRRLGESQWRSGKIDLAKQTWERLINKDPEARKVAELASWYEIYDFPDDAIKFYRQAIELTPNKEWSFRLAEHLFEKGENEAAITTWESVLNPETAVAVDYAELAAIFDAYQLTEKAELAWSSAIKQDSENLDYHLQLARNLMRQEKFKEAVRTFTHLTDQTENTYFQDRGETGRLDAFSQLGILDEKQKEWEQELADNPESIEVIGRLAKLYQRAGQRESALSLLEKRSELEPNNTDFRRDLIRSFKSGRYIDEAIAELLKLAAADKTRARVYYQELLEIYLSLDLRDEAIKSAETIIELAPADAEARLDLAQVYALYQRPEDGLQQYRYALRLEPNEPDYHRQYGAALLQERKYGEAQLAFQRMLDTAKEDGTRLSAVGSLTQIHQYQNSLDQLVTEFNRRIRNTPKKLSAYQELARVFQESGSVEKSLNTLEDALQNVDDKAPALQALIRSAYELQDFQKVLAYYEQLIEQRGKPSAFEYEKLGSIYAQMGDLSKARETWNLMIDEDSKDPKAYDRLSSILQRENFVNEAIDFKLQAVELDEYNFKRRWEYAQMLASTERGIDAIEQLQRILELGDRQQREAPEKVKEKSVRRRSRGPQAGQQFINPYMYIYGIQRSGQGYYGGSPRGNFLEIRPQIIGFMASLAQNSMGEDALIEQFSDKVKKQPKNTQAKRDLMLVYQSYGRVEDALKSATEILDLAPNDAELLQQTAVYYASQKEHAKAIPLLEKLAETQPKFRNQALQGLIPLYFQTEEQEKALELTNQMIEEDPSNTQTIYMLASLMQQQGKLEEAIEVYKKAMENPDPRIGSAMNLNLAQIYIQTGKRDEAKKLFSEMLTTDPLSASGRLGRRPRVELYMPELGNNNQRVRYGGGAIRNLPPTLIGQIDYRKSEAIRQLRLLAVEGENPVEPLEKQAEQLLTAKNINNKDSAWDAAKLLIAYHLSESEYDEAQAWLDKLATAASDRLEWLNLSLFLSKSRDDCESMVAHYADAEARFPAIARKLVTAKAAVSILCERYEDAATYIRQMDQQRVPPKEIVAMIQPLLNADESDLAKTLLEEHLAGISRNGEALALLANIYGEEDNHEQAIALAREAWDRSSHGNSNQNYRYTSYYPGRTTRPTDALLRSLHQYYVKAGRSEDLVQEFTKRLDQQPGSVQLHENLATLHQLNNDRESAIIIYEALILKRPHLTQAKQTLARFHSETGNFAKATEIYEKLLKTNPNIYQQISWELRNLYQRSGKGKEITEMEKNLAKRATNPNQIQQLASQFQRSGEFEKAAELYLKAIKMSPGYPWLNRQLADVYIKLGKHDAAIDLYREWLASPTIRAQGNVDTGTLQHLAGVFTSTGRLDELKEINQGFLDKNENDPIAVGLTAQIAVFEKRFDDAIKQMAKAAKSGRDPNALNGLLELGEITGRIDTVFDSIKDPSLFQTFYDKRRIAKIFLAKGDLAKGKKIYGDWVDEQSQHGGSTWYYIREAVDSFSEYGLWEDAEELVRKHHRKNMPENDRREFSRIISDFYVNNDRFGDFVEGILSKETYKGSDADLITSIANGYRQSNLPDKRLTFLSRIVDRDSSNRKLVTELAQVHLTKNPKKA